MKGLAEGSKHTHIFLYNGRDECPECGEPDDTETEIATKGYGAARVCITCMECATQTVHENVVYYPKKSDKPVRTLGPGHPENPNKPKPDKPERIVRTKRVQPKVPYD